MKKERSINELLKLMLDNQDLFQKGLSDWVNRMYLNDVISSFEHTRLQQYIGTFHNTGTTVGKLSPRIKWIKKHIERTKE